MAEVLQITGGTALSGSVRISGAKNAALPMLLASLLSSEPVEFENVPILTDVDLTIRLLEHFGANVEVNADRVRVAVPTLRAVEASYSLVKALRASFWILAPLLARGRAARVALPGGDIIGARPVDMHLDGLVKMGADIKVKHGVVFASASNGLRAAEIDLRFPSVGATHQLIMAMALTPGTSVIRGAAREPEVVALAELINSMGGSVEGAGHTEIVIRGRDELGGARVRLIGDRVEAATYIMAAVATRGSISLNGINPQHLGALCQILISMGALLELRDDGLSINAREASQPVQVATGPFPELATDFQALLMAALTLAQGESRIEENIFEGRFGHVSELCRLGARILVEGRSATIIGVPRLAAAPIDGLDIRAAAALVIAALAAEGTSTLAEIHHLRRGYEGFERKFNALGAKIVTRVQDPEDFLSSGC